MLTVKDKIVQASDPIKNFGVFQCIITDTPLLIVMIYFIVKLIYIAWLYTLIVY